MGREFRRFMDNFLRLALSAMSSPGDSELYGAASEAASVIFMGLEMECSQGRLGTQQWGAF